MVGVLQPWKSAHTTNLLAHLAVDLNPELICSFWVAITSQLDKIIFMAERMFHTNPHNFSSAPLHSSNSIIVGKSNVPFRFHRELGRGGKSKQANNDHEFLSSKIYISFIL